MKAHKILDASTRQEMKETLQDVPSTWKELSFTMEREYSSEGYHKFNITFLSTEETVRYYGTAPMFSLVWTISLADERAGKYPFFAPSVVYSHNGMDTFDHTHAAIYMTLAANVVAAINAASNEEGENIHTPLWVAEFLESQGAIQVAYDRRTHKHTPAYNVFHTPYYPQAKNWNEGIERMYNVNPVYADNPTDARRLVAEVLLAYPYPNEYERWLDSGALVDECTSDSDTIATLIAFSENGTVYDRHIKPDGAVECTYYGSIIEESN